MLTVYVYGPHSLNLAVQCGDLGRFLGMYKCLDSQRNHLPLPVVLPNLGNSDNLKRLRCLHQSKIAKTQVGFVRYYNYSIQSVSELLTDNTPLEQVSTITNTECHKTILPAALVYPEVPQKDMSTSILLPYSEVMGYRDISPYIEHGTVRELLEKVSDHKNQITVLNGELVKSKVREQETAVRLNAENTQLKQQIESHKDSIQEQVQARVGLTKYSQPETARCLEYLEQVKKIEKKNQCLELELENVRQAFKHAEIEHGKHKETMNDLLQQARQQMDESLRQTVKEYENQEDLFTRELKSHKASESKARSNSMKIIKYLKSEKAAYRSRVTRQKIKINRIEKLLLNEQKNVKRLNSMRSKLEEALSLSNRSLSDAKQVQLDLQRELKLEIESGERAWEKSADSAIVLELARLLNKTLKNRYDQELANIGAQLEGQKEHDKAIIDRYVQENEKLRKLLEDSKREVNLNEVTVAK